MHAAIEQSFFEALFLREYRGVLVVARRIVGCAAAEDIAQETFAALLRSGPAEPEHARNWLYRVAVHRAVDRLNRDRNRIARERHFRTDARAVEPAEILERCETRDTVRSALSRLKPAYATVLALRHSGLHYKEIAQIMNVKTERVGVLLIRAEAAFKKELDRDTHS